MRVDEIRRQLEFYRDLGVKEIYRAPARPVAVSIELPTLEPSDDTMLKIIEDIGDCKRCRLHAGRKRIVFGSGNESARLVFVGEGPGADEDEQGLPFVGRAGQLLTQMIEGTASKEGVALKRADVYICNVVKCRPPDNRDPRADEIAACRPYLGSQLELIRPKVVVTLGNFATKLLLETELGITKVRGKSYPMGDWYLVPTYHPAAALRSGGVVVAEMRADLVRAKQLMGWTS
jgi:uracil-DNA glycosylase